MRLLHTVLLLLGAAVLPAWAAGETTALDALNLLPKEAADRVAFIAGFEGTPAPERWHILVHDPAEANGVHEYVVSSGELVASRSVSQFAEYLRPVDVIGRASVKINTDEVGKLAQSYAEANRVGSPRLSYELRRDSAEAAPSWHVTCYNLAGMPVGKLVVAADKGTVLSHEGLPYEPTRMARPGDRPTEPPQEPAAPGAETPVDPNAPVAAASPFPTPRKNREKRPAQPERKPFFQRLFGGDQREGRSSDRR